MTYAKPKLASVNGHGADVFCSVIDSWGALIPYISVLDAFQKRGGDGLVCIPEDLRELAESASLSFVSDSTHRKEISRGNRLYESADNGLRLLLQSRRNIEAWLPHIMAATRKAIQEGRVDPSRSVVLSNSPGIFYLGPFWLEEGFSRIICLDPYLLYDWLGLWQNERSQFLSPTTPPWLGRLVFRLLFGRHGRALARKFLGRQLSYGFEDLRRAVIAQWHTSSPQLLRDPAAALGYCYPTSERGALPAALEAFLRLAKTAGRRVAIFTVVSMELSEDSMASMVNAFTEAVRHAPGWVGVVLGREALTTEEVFFHQGFVPFQTLFPRADLIVCHGGAGTTHFALRAGVPILMVPFLKDQFDRVHRLERLGMLAGRIQKPQFTAERIQSVLTGLGGEVVQNAQRVGALEREQYDRGLERVVDGLVDLVDPQPASGAV